MNKFNRSLVASATLTGLATLVIANGSTYAASTTTGTAKSAARSEAQTADLATLKTKGSAEINRRLTSLNSASSKISTTTKLSASDKSYLQNEINNEISGLTALQTSLNGETTLSAARTDVQSIFSDYRVYALVLPKTRLVTAADGEQSTDTKLTTLATQLQTKITTAQTAGKDVSTLQSDLNDMKAKTNSAQTIARGIESSVLSLQPTDYNSNHAVLSGDLSQIKTAHSDNKTAYTDAKSIATGLKT